MIIERYTNLLTIFFDSFLQIIMCKVIVFNFTKAFISSFVVPAFNKWALRTFVKIGNTTIVNLMHTKSFHMVCGTSE